MIFEKISYMIISLIVVLLFIILRNQYYKNFFEKVKKFWFYKPTFARKLSNIVYYLAFLVLVIAIGDLRGKEEIIEGNIPTQKTLIVIDNSLSMLVEDIRPNRIKKTLLMARHFIRNSYGHQVSIAVFSDLFKQIIPFTDDIEILEARLQTLNDAKSEGGSNIGNTLNEAFQYFQTKNGYEKGNIILFTDGEEQGSSKVKIPDEITLAVIAVGSENGGKIPLRSKDGQFQRYKKYNNEEVVSKLNKSFFTALEKSGSYVKVWFSQSYSLPTEDLLSFMNKVHESSFQKGSFRQRPVKGIPLIALFVVLYCLSIFLSRFKTFSMAVIAILFLSVASPEALAQEEDAKLNEYLEKYKNGSISREEKLDMAQLYMSKNENEKSSSIYRSVIKDLDSEKEEDVFNFATSLLKEGKTSDAMSLYKYLDKKPSISEELKEIIKKNMLHALKVEDEKQKQDQKKNDDEENQDQDENKNDKNENNKEDKNKNSKKDKKQNSKSGKKQEGEEGSKDKKKSSKDDKKNNSQDKNEQSGEGENNPKDQSQDMKDKKDPKNNNDNDKKDGSEKDSEKEENKDGKSFDEIKKEIELKKKKNGVKGVLKQIMDDDANLQRIFINSSSKENSSEAKDW